MATFYAMFSSEPRPATVVHVCDDIACRVDGAEELCAALEAGSARPARSPTATPPGCAAPASGCASGRRPCCYQRAGRGQPTHAPFAAAPVGRRSHARSADGRRGRRSVRARAAGPSAGRARGCCAASGVVDPPRSTTTARTAATRRCAAPSSWAPTGVIREVKDAKLLGRGGAAFPTGREVGGGRGAAVRPHYFICNADESEPGTFKDRVVMEQRPVRRDRGPHDRRASRPAASRATSTSAASTRWRRERLEHAIERVPPPRVPRRATSWARGSRSTSSCGAAPAPTSAARRRRCSTRSRASAASRGTSRRSRSQRGLFGKPTGINNVETLINVLEILRIGGAGVRADRHRGLHRAAAVLPVRVRRAAGPVRGRRSA